jgi:hypothetical protein
MELKEILNAMFVEKHLWQNISQEDKEKWFFVLNRNFSQEYPLIASFLNKKTQIVGLDYWFTVLKAINYIPKWAWPKRVAISEKKKLGINELEFRILKVINENNL